LPPRSVRASVLEADRRDGTVTLFGTRYAAKPGPEPHTDAEEFHFSVHESDAARCCTPSGGPTDLRLHDRHDAHPRAGQLEPGPSLPSSWLRNGASGLRVRHDFPLLLLMIRGVVSPGQVASTDR
jgi:hypothetical protein